MEKNVVAVIELEGNIYKEYKQICKKRKKSLSFVINETLETHLKFGKFLKEKNK